jgi:uncharacterized protein (TIGR02266 family)
MAEERRSARRANIKGVKVTYEESTGGRVEADALDLGTGGLFVRTAAPLAVGKRISLEMHVIGEPQPWSALGRVVWTRTKGEGDHRPPGMGVKLIDVEDEVTAAIDRLVETRERTEPGVGKGSTPPPPAPVVAVAPERERTLLGVGVAPGSTAPPPDREQSLAIDLVPRRPASTPPPPQPVQAPPQSDGAMGRWVVILLLVVVAAIAAYVLLDGFLRPPGH